MSVPTFIINKASPLKAALCAVLGSVNIPASNVHLEDNASFLHLTTKEKQICFTDALCEIGKIATSNDSTLAAGCLTWPRSREDVCIVNQWISIALQMIGDGSVDSTFEMSSVSSSPISILERDGCLSLTDVESQYFSRSFVSKNEFLCFQDAPTIADVLMFCACRFALQFWYKTVCAKNSDNAKSPTSADQFKRETLRKFPFILDWLSFVEMKLPMLKEIVTASAGVLDPVCEIAGDADKLSPISGNEAQRKSEFAIPDAEEIKRRRLEKDKRKAEKALLATKKKADAPVQGENEEDNVKTAAQLDLCVGRITSVRRHPEAEKLFIFDRIDFGPDTPSRTILSGITQFYTEDELRGRLVVAVMNMKPKPLKGILSEGMLLTAEQIASDGSENVKCELLSVSEVIAPGTRILFSSADHSSEKQAVLPSAKMTKLLSNLHTDENGVASWKDLPLIFESNKELHPTSQFISSTIK